MHVCEDSKNLLDMGSDRTTRGMFELSCLHRALWAHQYWWLDDLQMSLLILLVKSECSDYVALFLQNSPSYSFRSYLVYRNIMYKMCLLQSKALMPERHETSGACTYLGGRGMQKLHFWHTARKRESGRTTTYCQKLRWPCNRCKLLTVCIAVCCVIWLHHQGIGFFSDTQPQAISHPNDLSLEEEKKLMASWYEEYSRDQVNLIKGSHAVWNLHPFVWKGRPLQSWDGGSQWCYMYMQAFLCLNNISGNLWPFGGAFIIKCQSTSCSPVNHLM